MDLDSINGGTPATKGWLRPVCGDLQAKNLYADNLYLTGGGSGIPGPPGPPGEQGPQGPPGQSASISVESVTTGAPGSAVIFQNVGAGPSAAFVVSIPRGDPGVGEQGPPGNPGAQGPAGIMTVGTVTTGAPGSAVSFVNVGSPENATFDISIPRGDVGPKGDQGDPGPAGAPGGSASILTYRANTTTLLPVSTVGDLVWNTDGQTDATLIYLSHRQVGGQDVERILELATVGSTMLIQAQTNSGQYQTFTMTEPPVATPGAYVTFFVTLDDTGGALFTNNNNLLVSIVIKGTPGPEGPPGEAGPPGATGAQGDPGPPGDAATITVGATTTGAPGTSASVVAVGTSAAQIFDFTIPTGAAGPPGAPGAQGDPGPAGAAATLTVGSTTTGAPGSAALVTQSGTSAARVFDFTIPQGIQGPIGPQGPAGTPGNNVVTKSFLRNANNQTAGFYADAFIQLGWDGNNGLWIVQPTARTAVYTMFLVSFGTFTYPNGQSMLLSTTNKEYWTSSGLGQIEFTISSNGDITHPFYQIRFLMSTSMGTDRIYCVIEQVLATAP